MSNKITKQQFGGDWTADKLERVRKYLSAYTKIMSSRTYFRTFYLDAFAGTGYNAVKQDDQTTLLFPEFAESETKQFLEGSVRIALRVEPRFNKYVFIEKDPQRFGELESLKTEFSVLQNDIEIVNSDANLYITNFCRQMRNNDRAVLFLDPFGMQVPWQTIVTIAHTQKIDLWYLFPLGVAVNRLLKRDGNINQGWRHKLDEIFGASDWFETFYRIETQPTLFGEESSIKKVADFNLISRYMVSRLKTIFPGVANNPLELKNSRLNTLYLLCFASSNPKGSTTAIKIAQDILRR